jgi:hypothetical protein
MPGGLTLHCGGQVNQGVYGARGCRIRLQGISDCLLLVQERAGACVDHSFAAQLHSSPIARYPSEQLDMRKRIKGNMPEDALADKDEPEATSQPGRP